MFPGAHAATRPDHPAIVMAATGATTTYAELDAGANRLAGLLASSGLRPGDHVAFCLENSARFLEVAWGCHYAGLVYTACSTRLTPGELAYIVDDCGARAFIASAATADAARAIVDATPGVELRLMVEGHDEQHRSYDEAVAAHRSTPHGTDRVEGVDMLYSSGTTGQPKGVATPLPGQPLGTPTPLTLLCQALFGFDADMTYLTPAPLYHSAPLRFTMQVHRVGGTSVVMERFDGEAALEAIERYGVTHSQWVPTMFIRLLQLPEDVRAEADVSSMRAIVHAAAPCPVPVKRQMIDWFGPIVHEYYAGTEGNGFVYCNADDWLAHPGTVGRPLNSEVHIVNDDGNECPPGTAGTIWFSGGTRFEYHNDPAKTKASRNEAGWSTLGDVGYLDDDGFLFLTDRKAHMIITGGVNVYPQEAENVLAVHPRVADVAVIGVPDDTFGEAVKAVVQPLDLADAGTELEQELIAWCRERLADVKCPRTVDFRAELPRQPTGKLYKRLLKDEYWAGHGTSRII